MRPQRSEKRLQECDSQLTTEDVNAFTLSKVLIDAADLLERARHGQSMTNPELCLIQDMIIAELTITTGMRPGGLGNATVRHFRSSHCDMETKLKVMLVPDHKHGVPGPAPITFLPEVDAHMQTYLQFVRPQFGGSQDGALFLTPDGTPFTKDTIRRHVWRNLEEVWGSSRPQSNCLQYMHMDSDGVPWKEGRWLEVR